MRRLVVLFCAVVLLFTAVASCKKSDKTNPDYAASANCSGLTDSLNRYTNSIKSILDTRCAASGCHGNGSAESGVSVSTYANAKSAFQNKNALCAVHHGNGCQPMPQGGSQLSDAELNKLDCWAQHGYKQ